MNIYIVPKLFAKTFLGTDQIEFIIKHANTTLDMLVFCVIFLPG